MHLLRRFTHRHPKGTPTGALIRTVADALAKAGHVDLVFHAYFSDFGHRKVSAVGRLLDRYADLITTPVATALIATTMQVPDRHRDGPAAYLRPLDVDTAIAIADGIPQRYPFFQSHFYVSPVPALELYAAPRRTHLEGFGDADGAEIVVVSQWGSTRRETGIRSAITCPVPPADAKRVPKLPPTVKDLLDALGKPGREEQKVIRTEAERAADDDAAKAHEAELVVLDDALLAGWPGFAFPTTLKSDHAHGDRPLDLRDALADQLGAAGWTYDSSLGSGAPGMYYLRRRTTADNELILSVDRKPLANTATAWLELRGPTWTRGVRVWPSPAGAELRIRSPDTARGFAKNLVAATAHALATWVAPVEARFGAGQPWLRSGRARTAMQDGLRPRPTSSPSRAIELERQLVAARGLRQREQPHVPDRRRDDLVSTRCRQLEIEERPVDVIDRMFVVSRGIVPALPRTGGTGEPQVRSEVGAVELEAHVLARLTLERIEVIAAGDRAQRAARGAVGLDRSHRSRAAREVRLVVAELDIIEVVVFDVGRARTHEAHHDP